MLVACASQPVYHNLSSGIAIEPVARTAAGSPFAPDPAGKRVAMADDGLALFDVTTRRTTQLSADIPQALAWSPDGRRLAVASRNSGDSRVYICESSGTVIGSSSFPGDVNALRWRGDNELLIATLELKVFSFGINFAQVLYRWDGINPAARIELNNATLRRQVYQALGPVLPRLLSFALSPYGDAIVYPRLIDPPMFDPHLLFVIRNLATGREREVAPAAVNSGGAVFAGTDDTVLYGDGRVETVLRNPWQARQSAAFPHPGRSLAASAGGRTLFIDGNLYRDGTLLLTFPANAAGAFNFDGTALFVRYEKVLYLVSGLPPDPSPTVPAKSNERLLTLRQWRSEELISPADFMKAIEMMEKQ
jgi:hypothetical protein